MGKRVREAIARDLFENRGMQRATDLVVSGCSAGGLATFLHTDQWCDALKSYNSSAKCVGLPDSGFFLDYQDAQVTCKPDGVDKWYIHHEGGGWCESMDDCLDRSKGRLGSTKADSETADLGGGYFSTDVSENPMMSNWNHV